MKLRCAGASDPGRMRGNNEDAFHADPERGIFLVVDGMGGQAAGEKAAGIAVERIRARLERATGTPEERVREAIAVANNEIYRQAQTHPEWRGMACVLTVAVVEDGQATVGHVGDSRLYKLRQGKIRKITHDHSPVGDREDRGELSETEAMRHPRRNEVFRDVGSEEHTPADEGFVDVARVPFEPDSALLLCSDGLSDQVTADRIQSIVAAGGDPESAVRELILAANEAGGKDNVTAVLVAGPQFVPAPASRGARWAFLVYGALAVGAVWGWFAWRAPRPPEPPRTLRLAPGAPLAETLRLARPGDTLELLPGDYPGPVELASGVTLRSADYRGAVLRGVAARGVKGVRVLGFRITAPETAVLIENAGVEIQDAEISGAATGIELRGAASATLRGCDITGNAGVGVLVRDQAVATLLHNRIVANGRGVKPPRPGIQALDGARLLMFGNLLADNGSPPQLAPQDAARNTILDGRRRGTGQPYAR